MIQVDKANVLTELGKGSKLFIVDFKTLKVCRSDDIESNTFLQLSIKALNRKL